ncbi:Inward rectifier potassium channel Irk [Flavipsychrobacter stenotrophus]|uniref:Inward rectifier potassium channel Irk n=1 Tax=Flavipsychrobacter stenotrophus TaxID=2077091 RepID=A0A2S7T1N7_9BACT|nr:ion channel [Flavipsychrobacter stenotrophus]PQJ12715.1 Inward rectifier potassium channel Irk [Flavipsychrobacter stenotrophus]
MATSHNKTKFKDISNTGFGANSSVEGGRLVNADGSNNLRKTGLPFYERISIYHSLLRMSRMNFTLTIFAFYTAINLFFAVIYFTIGVDHLEGIDVHAPLYIRFLNAFFFSSQTLTTVGYGHVAPSGILTNFVASTESLIGILAFAVVTGLIYGRFSRPRAYILFSNNLIVAPHKGGKALMARIATYKNNHLTDAEAQLTVALHVNENGKMITRFYQLPLEISKVTSLALSWTIVHPINEDSPIANFTDEQLRDARMEVILGIKAFDDHFSNTVQQRTSYSHPQLVYGAKFEPMFERSPEGNYTLLELDKISHHTRVPLEEQVVASQN